MTLGEHNPELEDVVKNSIRAIGLLTLLTGTAPAIAQTATHPARYLQTSALPPGAGSTASPTDWNAPRWILLEGYGGNGHLYQRWQLVRPQDFDASNYPGFHTSTE